MIFACIALLGPAIEIVRAARSAGFVAGVFRAGEVGAIACVHRIVLAAGGHLAFASERGDVGDVAVLVDINAEIARFGHRKRQVGRINLIGFAAAQFAHAHIDGAFGQPDLNGIVIEVEEGESRALAQTNRRCTGVQFGAPAAIGPKLVARSHGTVDHGFGPIACARRLHGHGTVQETDSRGARRRIAFIGSGRLRNSHS